MATQKHAEYSATGRRKNAVARVRLMSGEGKVLVNGRAFDAYFPLETLRNLVQQPLKATDTLGRFDVKATLTGGGLAGQAGAMRHGISRALVIADQNLRAALKDGGFLTRDPRMKERKKSGQPGARKRFQFSKR
jgi:small subunit ribosomal protein S9